MGGRALKKAFTRRYSREEFDTVSKELIDIIKVTFDRACTPLFFNNKETFGDIDIIVDSTYNYEYGQKVKTDGNFIREFIETQFKPTEIFHNGNAWSFDYKEVQVDFICVESDDFMSNFHYLAFNDLGNFIGRLAQSIGFKYGQEGLWYNHFSDANTKTTIMVSKDYPKIFEFLGLDYARWEEGFDTLEDIFEYAMTSSLFNVEMFQLSKLNKINRERNLKRASYMSFLEYIEGKSDHEDYNANVVSLAKENIVDIIDEYFPEANVKLHLAQINYEAAKKVLIHTKFNGNIVKEKYGLEGKELGIAMKGFKEYIETHDSWGIERNFGRNFNNYILETNIITIYTQFEEVLNERVS
jgi:hypothetical protein